MVVVGGFYDKMFWTVGKNGKCDDDLWRVCWVEWNFWRIVVVVERVLLLVMWNFVMCWWWIVVCWLYCCFCVNVKWVGVGVIKIG